ncbi:hypothetical protein VE04_09560 [Pseudogymnoascus sp. 24MN13]|nr:hypothetical protein VE04_09560 [Pseudogymnoascus sp. 24MN13]
MNTVTSTPGELFRQVATNIRSKYDDVAVTVPKSTTWRNVVRATEAALGDRDDTIIISRSRTEEQKERFRQIALDNVASWEASKTAGREAPLGQPIRTYYDAETIPTPKPSTSKMLKENMIPFKDMKDPYPITLKATLAEGYQPMVKATVVLKAVDNDDTTMSQEIKDIYILWDTGCHSTVVSDDLLTEDFRKYLDHPIHDPYRNDQTRRIQVEVRIALSNAQIDMAAVGAVIPKEKMPNGSSYIILGQSAFINAMDCRSIPRSILRAKGMDISDDVWGDIVVYEYIDEFGDLVTVERGEGEVGATEERQGEQLPLSSGLEAIPDGATKTEAGGAEVTECKSTVSRGKRKREVDITEEDEDEDEREIIGKRQRG